MADLFNTHCDVSSSRMMPLLDFTQYSKQVRKKERKRERAGDVQEVVQHCRREGRRIWATITDVAPLFPRASGAAVTYILSLSK